jgi:3-oxoacyl-[acyl-carrier protein] reductase
MDLGLSQRVYLVTGGTSGLGYATAEALVLDGAKVVVSSRDEEKVAKAAASLAAFGRVDGALVSVGGPKPGVTTAVSDEVWRDSFESIFLGTVRLVRHLAPLLAKGEQRGDGGAIAFVLSSSAKTPLPRLSVSNGLRAGLAMLVKDLSDELGPQDTRVLGLLPGKVLTDRTVALEKGDPEARTRAEGAIPLRRLGDPAEFGRMAAVLLSPAASYVTGSLVSIDGGAIRAL